MVHGPLCDLFLCACFTNQSRAQQPHPPLTLAKARPHTMFHIHPVYTQCTHYTHNTQVHVHQYYAHIQTPLTSTHTTHTMHHHTHHTHYAPPHTLYTYTLHTHTIHPLHTHTTHLTLHTHTQYTHLIGAILWVECNLEAEAHNNKGRGCGLFQHHTHTPHPSHHCLTLAPAHRLRGAH